MNAHDVIAAELRKHAQVDAETDATHALKALAAAGFAVVELPARNGNGEWPVGDGTVVYYDGNDQEIWYRLQCYPAAKARGVAAGLLAAADYADTEEAQS